MNFIGEEVITVTAGTTFTFNQTLIAPDGASRATKAVIYSHDQSGNSTVGLRQGSAPDLTNFFFTPLASTQTLTLEDYETLRDTVIALVGTTPAKLYVQYFS